MTRTAIASRLLPVIIVAAVLGASLLARPVALNVLNTAFCGYAGYGYGAVPSVDSVSPTGGGPGGGTTVTLTGCGFTGATSVKFGSTTAPGYTIDSDTQITTTSPAHSAGTVDISVTTPTGTSPAQAGDHFTYGTSTCTGLTMGGSPASPVQAGVTVTFTATATGCPNPLYEFWMRAASGTWSLAQTFSNNDQFMWNTTFASGTYYISAWAKDASSPTATFDRNFTVAFQVNGPAGAACTGVSLGAGTPASPQTAGTTVSFTANATGCNNPNPFYEFWLRSATGSWQIVQIYSHSSTLAWDTSRTAGLYYISVWAKDAASATATFDANRTVSFTVNAAACTGLGLSPSPASPQLAGTPVTFTATATGCSNANPFYEFWMRPASSSTWVVVQAFGTNNQFVWNTDGDSGTYYISAWTKDEASATANFDKNATATFVINTPKCQSVSIAAVPTTAVHGAAAHFVVTATAGTCTNAGPLFEFWVRTSTGPWMLAQAFSTSNSFNWDLSSQAAGTYYVSVWIKDAASPTTTFDANKTTSVTLT